MFLMHRLPSHFPHRDTGPFTRYDVPDNRPLQEPFLYIPITGRQTIVFTELVCIIPDHSLLRASIGSMFDARHAG
jgi:hypothetical protein